MPYLLDFLVMVKIFRILPCSTLILRSPYAFIHRGIPLIINYTECRPKSLLQIHRNVCAHTQWTLYAN